MKKETYTVALMPSSGRRMRTFSVSTSSLILVLVSLAIVVTLSKPDKTSSASATRFSISKQGAFPVLRDTATITESNSLEARDTRSICPLVMGSNVPGYTAMVIDKHQNRKRIVYHPFLFSKRQDA